MLDFIRREKIYIFMLLFILAVNFMSAGQSEKKQVKSEKCFSEMTLEEIGVTEERVKDFLSSGKLSARFFKYAIILGFLVFMFSIVMNLAFIFRIRPFAFSFSSLSSSRGREDISWGVPDLLRASLVIVFMSYVLGLAESIIYELLQLDIGINLRMMISTFFIDIAVVIVVLYFVVVKCKDTLVSLGLKLSSLFKNISSGIAGYIFILPLLFTVLIFSLWILNILGYKPEPQPVFEMFMEEKRGVFLAFFAIFVSILGPIIEEIFFRGFMYNAVKKHIGVIGAAFISASVFSLLHTNIVGFFPIMILGLLLVYLYERTGSLVASMAVHILHNAIIVGFVFFIKELMA